MKTVGSPLATYLASVQASVDRAMIFAELYTFTLQSGLVLRYTGADIGITYLGNVFVAGGPIIQGFKFNSTVGFNVDVQEVDIFVWPTYNSQGVPLVPAPPSVGGQPFTAAILNGVFDSASMQRDRVFFSDRIGGTVIGGVNLFTGGIASIDEVGRYSAKLSASNDLRLLNNTMPRSTYGPTCNHALYDSGCTVSRASFTTTGAVQAGSSARLIASSLAATQHVDGALTFTSGLNAGVKCSVKNISAGVGFILAFPPPQPVAVGDAFTVAEGCDHTPATCFAAFNNIQNFGGFPFVPPPQNAQ